MTVVARHPGRCGLCQQPIHEGEEIEQVDGEWCHSECALEDGLVDGDKA